MNFLTQPKLKIDTSFVCVNKRVVSIHHRDFIWLIAVECSTLQRPSYTDVLKFECPGNRNVLCPHRVTESHADIEYCRIRPYRILL